MRKTVLALLALAFLSAFSCTKDSTPEDETHSYTLSQARSAKRGVAQDKWSLPDTDIPALAAAMTWT